MGTRRSSQWLAEQKELRTFTNSRGDRVAGATSQDEASRIYQLGRDIESCLSDFILKGEKLETTGFAEILLPIDFGGLLQFALQSYARSNPSHSTIYRGWCGGYYVIAIKPSREWLDLIGYDNIPRARLLEVG